jgi:ATP-dependent DNA helicase RecQ
MTGEALKQRELLAMLATEPGSGIVYVATRTHAESVAQALVAAGHRATCYHAGLKRAERTKRQNAFMQGDLNIMVATCAFGMGIDKPDVRFVIHYDVSDGLDAYYQEVGRAGRDGEAARAILFFSDKDLNLKRFFAGGGRAQHAEVTAVLEALSAAPAGLTLAALSETTRLSLAKLKRVVVRLEDAGALALDAEGRVELDSEALGDLNGRVVTALDAEQALMSRRQDRIEEIRRYARARSCRRNALLTHFGEPDAACSGCDNCDEPLRGAA